MPFEYDLFTMKRYLYLVLAVHTTHKAPYITVLGRFSETYTYCIYQHMKNVVLLITSLATATVQLGSALPPPTMTARDQQQTHTYMHTLLAHLTCLCRAVIKGLNLVLQYLLQALQT